MPSVEELLSVAEVIADTRSTMDSRIELMQIRELFR